MPDEKATQYWIFQANPKVFRLKTALRYEVLETFAVTAHKKHVQIGDKVILWQTGKEAGVYGLASITSDIGDIEISEAEAHYYKTIPETPRVKIQVEYNLWRKPITKELLPNSSSFDEFYAGLPGSNFKATQSQYQEIVELIQRFDVAAEPEVTYIPRKKVEHPLNLILYGPPGTGKTYQTVNHALAILEQRSLEELALEKRAALRERYLEYIEKGQIYFITFHPSFSYEDFVEGIKPKVENNQVVYSIEDGIFKRLRKVARSVERVVLIIDEINRGNIPSIFGELITLLEPDKRAEAAEMVSVILPYSKQLFSVPANLYLLGTMNTTDRSAEALDVALRRRFTFEEVVPNPSIIKRAAKQPVTAGVDLQQLLRAINQRIEVLLDKDYCIGHAYFLEVTTLNDLKQVFALKVIPLLQEYFFNDLGKIGLVLGKDFIREKHYPSSDIFADFVHEYANELADKHVYVLRPMKELETEDFIRIYDKEYR